MLLQRVNLKLGEASVLPSTPLIAANFKTFQLRLTGQSTCTIVIQSASNLLGKWVDNIAVKLAVLPPADHPKDYVGSHIFEPYMRVVSWKSNKDHHAVQNSTKVLQIEPENVKALWHRGLATVALLSMNEFVSGKGRPDKGCWGLKNLATVQLKTSWESLEAKMHKFKAWVK